MLDDPVDHEVARLLSIDDAASLGALPVSRADGRLVVAMADPLDTSAVQTLRERLGQGRMPVRKAIDYAKQIAAGLAASHERGIVHRDLKPENILLTNRGGQTDFVKVLDFCSSPTPNAR